MRSRGLITLTRVQEGPRRPLISKATARTQPAWAWRGRTGRRLRAPTLDPAHRRARGLRVGGNVPRARPAPALFSDARSGNVHSRRAWTWHAHCCGGECALTRLCSPGACQASSDLEQAVRTDGLTTSAHVGSGARRRAASHPRGCGRLWTPLGASAGLPGPDTGAPRPLPRALPIDLLRGCRPRPVLMRAGAPRRLTHGEGLRRRVLRAGGGGDGAALRRSGFRGSPGSDRRRRGLPVSLGGRCPRKDPPCDAPAPFNPVRWGVALFRPVL